MFLVVRKAATRFSASPTCISGRRLHRSRCAWIFAASTLNERLSMSRLCAWKRGTIAHDSVMTQAEYHDFVITYSITNRIHRDWQRYGR
jgi:hypothetical protein